MQEPGTAQIVRRALDNAATVYNRSERHAETIRAADPIGPGVSLGYYKRHVFFCCNQREAGARCCNSVGSQEIREYAKERIKQLKLNGPGKIRVNLSGCLDRCERGPVIVVYPEAVWYTYVDRDDIDEIIREHLQHGRIVERLQI